MKSRAAVAFNPGEPLKIVEIDVEEPKANEVSKYFIPLSVIQMPLPYPVMMQKVSFQPC